MFDNPMLHQFLMFCFFALTIAAALTPQLLLVMALAGGALGLMALAVQNIRRYRATGIAGVIVPDTTIAAPKLPYGIAIAAGAFYAGVQMLGA
jgi:hypothetical protein